MSRQDRLKQYSRPADPANWCGSSRDPAYIERWSERAHQESDGHRHRASNGPMQLPDTAETAPRPTPGRSGDQRNEAKADRNFVGTDSYYPKARRNA